MGEQVVVRNTICPDCEGTGVRHVARGIVSLTTHEVDTVLVPEQCRNCHGHGRRPGFQPPV